MDTPLVDALLAHLQKDPAPFHMPGHKGRMGHVQALSNIAELDLTELSDTGDLYAEGGPVAAAQDLWAEAWGFPHCQFLTGGSTQGIHAALLLCARRGRQIIVDRCSHRSVYNGLGLFDLAPVPLLRRQDAPVSPRALRTLLTENEEVTAVCITSPTYYGVLSDIPALARIAHSHGAALIVDAAHGAHLPFLGKNPFLGADLVVSSAHKTLPVYGQGALLFSGGAYTGRDLRYAASVCGTSSPSYPVMASMDCARAFLLGEGGKAWLDFAQKTVRRLGRRFPHVKGAEPLRFTLTVNAAAADGGQVKDFLEARGIFCEMADRDHVVFLVSGGNTPEDVARLFAGLEEAEKTWPGVYGKPLEPPALPGAPIRDMSPARALTAPGRLACLADSVGHICLEQVAPYPPGVPVIAPGERITKKGLAYLTQVGYNIHQDVYIDCWEEE